METKKYGVANDIEWLILGGKRLDNTHMSYVELVNAGVATSKNRRDLVAACTELIDRGAEVIVLSGTDLFLAFDDILLSIDAIDCAEVHIKHLLECGSTRE